MQKRLILLFSALSLLTSISAFAQEQFDRYYLFENFNTRNGLVGNVIYSINQDRYGFIWICSDLGFSRFDGKSFYHNAIPDIYDKSPRIYYSDTTENGNIICAAFMEGIYIQFDDGNFKNYYTSPKSIGKNIFFTIKQGLDKKILLGGTQGLFKIDNDSLSLLVESEISRRFYTLEVDKNNNIWFGGVNGLGYIKSDESGLTPFIIPEFEDVFIVFILFDNEGVVHVATNRGYYRIDFEEPFLPGSKYTVSQPVKELIELNINHIYLDSEQNIWISTSSDGVYRTRGDSITMHLTINNGLLSSSVMCLTQDREGNYYFGTNNGISIVKDFNTYALARDNKLFQDVYDIISDKYNRVWMRSQNVFHFIQNEQIYQINLKNTHLEKTGITDFYINKQSIMLFSTNSELYKIQLTENIPDMKNAEKVADISGYKSARFWSMFDDNNGLWMCARAMLFNYNHDRFLPVTFNHPDSSSLYLQCITNDNMGYYWLGDNNNGLFRATMTENTKDKVVFDNIKAYKYLNADSAFVAAGIYYMTIDKEGYLWHTSLYTGAYKHTLDSSGIVSSKLYSIENGLLSNNVLKIDCKNDGRIWIYTQKGICILSQDSNGGEHFDYLDEKDGIVGQPVNAYEMENQIFTLTYDGFFVTPVNFSEDKKDIIPKVVITGLTVDGTDFTSWVYKNEMLPLGYTQNNLVFDFSSISFGSADDIAYQYKLDGFDKEWSDLSNRSNKEYTSLRPGKYTFSVRPAIDNDTFGDVTSFTFRINPAYYQTVWFYLLIFILISAVVYIIYRNRIYHAIKTERLRLRIAADLHDEIGSSLSSIFMMSDMIKSNDKQSMLSEALHKISLNSRDILNSMDDIIWSVNPQEDSLENLTVRLREYAIPVCESRGITLHMDIDKITDKIKLGMEERRNIFLITKESINNALKHSGCTTLSVVFSVTNKYIEVSVSDNGSGFDPASPTSRNGVINMHSRAKQIDSELKIISEKGIGTTIRLKVKNYIF